MHISPIWIRNALDVLQAFAALATLAALPYAIVTVRKMRSERQATFLLSALQEVQVIFTEIIENLGARKDTELDVVDISRLGRATNQIALLVRPIRAASPPLASLLSDLEVHTSVLGAARSLSSSSELQWPAILEEDSFKESLSWLDSKLEPIVVQFYAQYGRERNKPNHPYHWHIRASTLQEETNKVLLTVLSRR